MAILIFQGLALLTALINMCIIGFPMPTSEIAQIILLHQFAVSFGLMGILAFPITIINGDKLAEKLGWPGGPYQVKYGFTQVGLGVLGVMCIWFRGNFWAATLVAMYMYGISGFWTHVSEMVRKHKVIANDMICLFLDVTYQAILTWLSIAAGGIWILN